MHDTYRRCTERLCGVCNQNLARMTGLPPPQARAPPMAIGCPRASRASSTSATATLIALSATRRAAPATPPSSAWCAPARLFSAFRYGRAGWGALRTATPACRCCAQRLHACSRWQSCWQCSTCRSLRRRALSLAACMPSRLAGRDAACPCPAPWRGFAAGLEPNPAGLAPGMPSLVRKRRVGYQASCGTHNPGQRFSLTLP